jgi:pimeloyl-ACP methyl ester carboxylesterase
MKVRTVLGLFGLLIGLGVVALSAYLWTPDKARRDLEARYLLPSDAIVTVLGTQLRVRDTGPKDSDRPPVILIHGFGSSLETWDGWAIALEKDRRVIRFDLPGSGLSHPDGNGDYTDARTLTLLAALMDEKGIAQADIIGNSIGGRIAWRFAGAYPNRLRKLVLVSPDGFASPGFEYGKVPHVPAIMTAMVWTLPKSMLKANLEPTYGDPKRLTAATVTRYHDLMLGPGSRKALLARMKQTVLVDPANVLPRISAPTLLLWGEKDALIPLSNAQEYLALMPNVSLVVLPNMGHVPFEEVPAASMSALVLFLNAL